MLDKMLKPVSPWSWQIILVVCVIGTTALLVLSEISHQRVAKDYATSLEAMRAHAQLGRVARRLAEAESGQRGYLLTQDPAYLNSYTTALPYFKPLFDQLTLHYTDSDMAGIEARVDPRLNSFLGLTVKKLSELDITINMTKAGDLAGATKILKSGVGRKEMDSIRSLVEEMQKEQEAKSADAIKRLLIGMELSRWAIGILAAMNIVLLILVIFWLRNLSRQNLAREASLGAVVQDRTEQLALLATHLQEISESEKTRLGRELHDELGAILTASKMDLAWVKGRLVAEQPELTEKLVRALKNLDQGIQIKRRIIEGLRPTTLASFGLVTAARELIELAAEQANWKLELDLPDTDPDLSDEAEITLFRILQESVTNITKYAQASCVRVSLMFEQDEYCKLEIEDNGIGFRQVDVRPKAAGLVGMRERLRARGGRFDIESGPGKGTLIRALLPLEKTNQSGTGIIGNDTDGDHPSNRTANATSSIE